MLKASIKMSGLKEMKSTLNGLNNISLVDCANAIKDIMIFEIDSQRKRPIKTPEERYAGMYSEHIKDCLTVEVYPNRITIGNVAEMDEKVPYWQVLNNGGYVPVATHGYFDSTGAFTYATGGPPLIPTNAIQPVHYIETAMLWAEHNLQPYLNKAVLKALKDGRSNALVTIQ